MDTATRVPWRVPDLPTEGPEPDFPGAAERPPEGATGTETEPAPPSIIGGLVPVMEHPGEPGSSSPGVTIRISDADAGSWFG